MSYRVIVRRTAAGVITPIAASEWETYARACAALTVTARPDGSLSVRLKDGSKEDWLLWDHGEILTRNPSDEVAEQMFAAATALQASVVTDKGNIYASYEDWDVATRAYRADRVERDVDKFSKAKSKLMLRLVMFVGLIAIVVMLGRCSEQ